MVGTFSFFKNHANGIIGNHATTNVRHDRLGWDVVYLVHVDRVRDVRDQVVFVDFSLVFLFLIVFKIGHD